MIETDDTQDRPRARQRAAAPARLAAAIPFAAALAACSGDGSTKPDPGTLEIEASGRLERSTTVALRALRDGEPLPASSTEWSVEPAAAAEFLPGDSARLLEAGRIAFTAESGGESGRRELDVAVPPVVVFDLLLGGDRDIYGVALDGRDLLRLTATPADDRDPTVAADVVVFTSYRDGNGELYAVSLSHPAASPVRLTTTSAAELGASLSPDGVRLAYGSDASGVSKLWTAGSNGVGGARATQDFGHSGSIEGSPGWAPGSDRVVFMATSAGTADLYVLDVATGGITELVVGHDAEVEPAWSPDGEAVVFASNRDGPTNLYLVDVASGEVVRLTNGAGPDGQPAWLSDGRIVYTSWESGSAELRWLDPAEPASVRTIPIAAGEPGHPTGTD